MLTCVELRLQGMFLLEGWLSMLWYLNFIVISYPSWLKTHCIIEAAKTHYIYDIQFLLKLYTTLKLIHWKTV